MADLWHVREELLTPGDIIVPGRWGATIAADGPAHLFYAREHLLEAVRTTQTTVAVSRLLAAYAFEDRATVADWCRDAEHIYRVEPVDPTALSFRGDMLWLTWMGEPGVTADQRLYRAAAYWASRSTRELNATANPAWERLFLCGLRVVELVD